MGDGDAGAFDTDGTIGIEEEFYLVDNSGEPLAGTDELCYEYDPPDILAGHLDHELFTFIIEAQTPIVEGLETAPEALRNTRSALVEYGADHGYHLAAAGLHPTARWRELQHVTRDRYRRQLDRIQYPQHRNITAGLHVHVGVDDGDRAVWISDELRWYLPLILAISVNSPFWYGFDTGLASARARIFGALPNTGMPPAYGTLDTFLDLERTLLETGSIQDRGEVWFDIRPHTGYGTVEVRTPDAQRDEERVLALVEYIVRLVDRLGNTYERLRASGDVMTHVNTAHAEWAQPSAERPVADRLELLQENKWRALRYGWDGAIISRSGDGTIDILDAAWAEVDRLDLDRLPTVLETESGATRQRRLYDDDGMATVLEDLLLEPH